MAQTRGGFVVYVDAEPGRPPEDAFVLLAGGGYGQVKHVTLAHVALLTEHEAWERTRQREFWPLPGRARVLRASTIGIPASPATAGAATAEPPAP